MLRHARGYALANKGHDTRAPQTYLSRTESDISANDDHRIKAAGEGQE